MTTFAFIVVNDTSKRNEGNACTIVHDMIFVKIDKSHEWVKCIRFVCQRSKDAPGQLCSCCCVTFAQTAPFSDLPVAERSGRMDKKISAAENEK